MSLTRTQKEMNLQVPTWGFLLLMAMCSGVAEVSFWRALTYTPSRRAVSMAM